MVESLIFCVVHSERGLRTLYLKIRRVSEIDVCRFRFVLRLTDFGENASHVSRGFTADSAVSMVSSG